MQLKSYRKRVPHTATALTPMQVAKAYNFPTGIDLSHRTVAILELGGFFNVGDVYNYCKRYGIKAPKSITTVFADELFTSPDPFGADGEVCLDIDVIAAVAQGVNIIVGFGPNSDSGFVDCYKTLLSHNPDAISISWGSPENTWAASTVATLDSLFQQAAEKGIATFAASGDNGSSDGTSGDVTDFPASSQYAIACGGTRLELNADGTRLAETGWTSGGGGISKLYPNTPTWQQGTLLNVTKGRRVPDVAGNADPNSGYIVDVDGQLVQIGGTSAVAPLMAAYQAILNEIAGKHVGNMHTKLYRAPGDCFYDVNQGSNGDFASAKGYDCVSGIGALDASKLTKYLATAMV